MKKTTFREMTDRNSLKLLEEKILMECLALQEKHGCDNRELISVMVDAAYEMAKRGNTGVGMSESFNYHIIEQCNRNLGRLRNRFC